MYPQQALPLGGHWLPSYPSSALLSYGRDLSPLSEGPLTPPENMDALHPSVHHAGYSQELGRYYSEKNSSRYGSYQGWDVADSRPAQHGYHSQLPLQQQPQHQVHQPTFTQTSSPPSSYHSQQSRTASSASLIAPALQIPHTINNSQGSLAEFAAQITCFFWFESASTLDLADSYSSLPAGPLSVETTPTTGFRKFVTTLLSTTQVAQNVVVLGLLFIYRLKRQNPSVKGKLGSEYRLLTVALMLGNKFLDDNTYTNKTWADVSGISVDEVHIMEVEFLSNMKYNLFTSMEQWNQWQTQLNRFARFIERASLTQQAPSNTMTLLQSAFVSSTLPSPPNSFQTSPPRPTGPASTILPTPLYESRPLPLGPGAIPSQQPPKRKRSVEEDELHAVAKRMMQQHVNSAQHSPAVHQSYPASRPIETLVNSHSHDGSITHGIHTGLAPPSRMGAHLPPLPQRPGSTAWPQSGSAQIMPMNAMAAALRSAQTSRIHSPHVLSNNVSPTNTSMLATPDVNSPTYLLGRRDSPYKPVRGVHTLLVPPPVRAMHQPGHVDHNQMQFQPLGRPAERQEGRLPYIAQNQWYDGLGQQRYARQPDQCTGVYQNLLPPRA